MKVLLLDRSSHITGDMLVGALCDLGVKPSALEWELSKVEIGDFHMHFEKQEMGGQTGIRFSIHEGATHTHEQDEDAHKHHHEHEHEEHGHAHTHVHADGTVCHHDHSHDHEHDHEEHTHEHAGHSHEEEHEHHHHAHGRSLAEVQHLIASSELSPFVKEHALSIFTRLASDEGEHATFGLSSIAEVICTCAGLEALGVTAFHVPEASPLEGAFTQEFARPQDTPALLQGKIGHGAGSDSLLRATYCDLVES